MFEFQDVKYKGIIDIPCLSIDRNKITTLTGASGSGKTTILKLLNKMLSPDEGQIMFEGRNLEQADTVAHRRKVTMLSQTPAIFEGNVKDNLVAGLRFQKRDIPQDALLVAMLEKVKLDKELTSSVLTLSGGEKQRLALARVLLLDSQVYLLDEPSSALDEATAEMVIRMTADYVRRENKTLVMVTHSKNLADRFSDEIIEVAGMKCNRRPA